MLQRVLRPLSMFALVLTGALVALLLVQNAPRPALGAGALSPNVNHTILNVSCISAPAFDQNYTKITDVGDFEVFGSESVVELTYQGRVSVNTLVGASGSVFELRVDDLPSPLGLGRGRAHIETVGSQGEHVTFSAVFPDLEPGIHTASVWVRTSSGHTGTGGRVDPGCWSSDVIIVREVAAYGHIFLPLASED